MAWSRRITMTFVSAIGGCLLLWWLNHEPSENPLADLPEVQNIDSSVQNQEETPQRDRNPKRLGTRPSFKPRLPGETENHAEISETKQDEDKSHITYRWVRRTGFVPLIEVLDKRVHPTEPQDRWMGDSLILATRNEETAANLIAELKQFGVNNVASLASNTLWRASISPNSMNQYFEIINNLQGSDRLNGVSHNQIMSLNKLTSDPLLPLQYGIGNLKTSAIVEIRPKTVELRAIPNPEANLAADIAWDTKRDCRPISIGVIDSGIDVNHPDLKDNINLSLSENFATERSLSQDCSQTEVSLPADAPTTIDKTKFNDDDGHGTHVAGTIGAIGNNAQGVSGVCWRAEIVSLRVANSCGRADRAALLSAINSAKEKKIRVLNISMGGQMDSTSNENNTRDGISRAVVASFLANGGLIVAAAGNGNKDISDAPNLQFPGSLELPGLITIASINADNNLSVFSNHSATRVHAAAPGEMIISTFPRQLTPTLMPRVKTLFDPIKNRMSDSFRTAFEAVPNMGYEMMSGTSMATPHVSGSVALLWSLVPFKTNIEIASIILETSDVTAQLNDKTVNGRRVNLRRAIQTVMGYSAEAHEDSNKKMPDVAVTADVPVLIKVPNASGINLDNAKLTLGDNTIGACSKTDESCIGRLSTGSNSGTGPAKESLRLTITDGMKSLTAGSVRLIKLSDKNGLFKATQSHAQCRTLFDGRVFSVFSSADFTTCKNICRILVSGTKSSTGRCEYGDLSENYQPRSCKVE